MEIIIGRDRDRTMKQAIEGPTRRQAVGMAKYRRELLALSEKSPNDPRALDWDMEAWKLEDDLRTYGFDPETGRRLRKGA